MNKTIEERLAALEAHVFGKAEQAQPLRQAAIYHDGQLIGVAKEVELGDPIKVFDAGFVFNYNQQGLIVPDSSMIWLSADKLTWMKSMVTDKRTRHKHTLIPVTHHTAGRFYALAGIEPNHLSDWRSYAMCVKDGEVPYFVRPTSEYGVVTVERIRPSHVSLLEVTRFV